MDIRREDGFALIVALMALLLLTALSVTLALGTSLETTIAGNFRENQEAFYAADAIIERAMDDLSTAGDWLQVLTGSLQSSFIDGPPGPRSLADRSTVELVQVENMANCRQPTTCSGSEMDVVTADRPWATRNPRWHLYAYGNLRDLLPPGAIDSSYYVIVMVAADPSADAGALALRAEAFGPRGAHRTIEASVARRPMDAPGRTGLRLLSWRHLRG